MQPLKNWLTLLGRVIKVAQSKWETLKAGDSVRIVARPTAPPSAPIKGEFVCVKVYDGNMVGWVIKPDNAGLNECYPYSLYQIHKE